MTTIQSLLKEMNHEAEITRAMLSRVPADKFGWQPHPKSMKMSDLAVHIAEIPTWVPMMLHTDGMDFAEMDYTPTPVNSTDELVALFERSLAQSKASLSQATEADLEPKWPMRYGETLLSDDTKGEGIRHAYSQMVHHRAQLGVYLRLLDIPIPGSYGPSADDPAGKW